MNNMAIIILAAGNSSRLGQPKQLLDYRGKTLLQHMIDEALASNAGSVVVVLGANSELICEKTKMKGTTVIINDHWASGMASSIRVAIEAIASERDIDGALLTLCDQPHVDSGLLKALMKTQHESGKSIVACTYEGIVGVPAIFSRDLFPALLSLKGQEGARKLIAANPHRLEVIPFPKGIIDIDTLAAYQRLKDDGKDGSGEGW